MDSKFKLVGHTNEHQLCYVANGDDGLFYPDTDHGCDIGLYIADDERSQLVRDGVPTFYISTIGNPACTHRMDESDIPVWCKNAEDAFKVMDIVNTAMDKKP